tara:strand:+ start:1587 stop:2066 length:480 start_codon:yes stop_codon:yes gene_type:complete
MGEDSSREEAFTTIRITKRDRELLSKLALPRENAWETFRRVLEAAAVGSIKKKEKEPAGMSKRYARIVNNIENCFLAYRKQGVYQVAFTQVKDWVNENTKDGISSPRLANFLRRRPQFNLVRKERRHGSNKIQCYWSLDNGDNVVVNDKEATPGYTAVL